MIRRVAIWLDMYRLVFRLAYKLVWVWGYQPQFMTRDELKDVIANHWPTDYALIENHAANWKWWHP